MNYLNENCPVCGKQFTPQDDVVVCPDCGAPHHRDCWREKSACAFSAAHRDGYTWQPTPPAQEPQMSQQTQDGLRCPRCGEPCSADTLVCPTCGNRLGAAPEGTAYAFNEDYFMRGVDAQPDADLDGVTAKEAAIFVQQRAGAYVRKFQKQKNTGRKVGWNWAAFLFSPFWFFYRKIYKAGALFMGIWMVLCVFLSVPMARVESQTMEVVTQYLTIDETTTPETLSQELAALDTAAQQKVQQALSRSGAAMLLFVAALFVPNFFAAMFSDSVYKKKVVKDVQTMRDFAQNEQTFKMLALRRGGVSVFGLLGCYLMLSVFLNVVFYLS
ncbi:MAG: RING finger protein [Acutalibacteraceae bacterium]